MVAKALKQSTKKLPTVMMPIDDIIETIFVRRGLDEDRVLHFEELYRAGEKVEPIWITEDHELIAGRHRKAGAKRAGKVMIECVVKPNKPRGQLIMMAFKENLGGSLPPSRGDIEFAIQQMLENKVMVQDIIAQVDLPRSVLQIYIRNARSRIAQAKLNKALAAMIDENLSMNEAAKKYDIPWERLKEALQKRKKKSSSKSGAPAIKSKLTQAFRNTSLVLHGNMRVVFSRIEVGDMTPKDAETMLKHARNQINSLSNIVEDWENRTTKLKE
jgi:ParB-like chromosome segregation protein Spo0J